jgi:hypothetical protein
MPTARTAAKKPAPKAPPPKAAKTFKSKNIRPKTVAELKGASYNPRVITDKQLAALKKSMNEYGDLSGVVFNRATGVLISGHQRMKTVKGDKTKIVKTEVKPDRTGTVAVGHIEVMKDGALIKIPYREVDWTDKKVEMAANIAANAMGGDFDQEKLGAILQELQQGEFDIEATGLDNWDAQRALIANRSANKKTSVKEQQASGKKSKRTADESDEEFEEIDPDAIEDGLQHCCPKCKFRF